jgi:hypothetical protein
MSILMYKLIENTKKFILVKKLPDHVKQFNVITCWSYVYNVHMKKYFHFKIFQKVGIS